MSENYSVDYWYNDSSHSAWDFGGEKYYVNTFYEEIIKKLDIPDNCKILVLGTHNCVSFDKLCKHFGYNRCLGYDIANPKNHPNVIIKNCMNLNDKDNLNLAFCHNDLGNYSQTPKLKEHGQKWLAKNIIMGGWVLCNNNFNRAKVKNIEIMEKNGFKIYQLLDLVEKYNIKYLPYERIEGYMICQKIK